MVLKPPRLAGGSLQPKNGSLTQKLSAWEIIIKFLNNSIEFNLNFN
jgi:hypothetical protein